MARTARGFEFFEHTADVGIRAWGPTLGDAFAAAGEGLVANMVDASAARDVGEARLDLEADSIERLLHHFLEEILFVVQSRGWIVTRIEAEVDVATGIRDRCRIRARLQGEAYDAQRHGHVHEIKAITMHALEVRAGPPAEISVIVDI